MVPYGFPQSTPDRQLTSPPKGRTTLKITGLLMIASAVIEFVTATGSGPVLGGPRAAWLSIGYHVLFATVLGIAGWGLWRLRRAGYLAVFVAASLYTLDRALLLLNEQALRSYVSSQLSAHGDLGLLLDVERVVGMTQLTTALLIAGWWLFVVYMVWRKGCFDAPQPDAS